MKIARIIKNKSIPGEKIAFGTEPPLSREVFQQLEEGRSAEYFDFDDGALIIPRKHFNEIDSKFGSVMERLLTEAEQRVEQAKNDAKRAHDNFVDTISKQTGIPVA